MSTSLLYHGFGIRGYQYVRTRYEEGGVVFGIERPRAEMRCSHCGSADVHLRGSTDRTFRCPPIGGKPVFVEYSVPRLCCWNCHHTRQPDLGFADPKKHYTRSFERYALELSRLTTIQDAARHLDVSWDTVKEIQRRHLEKNYARPKLRNLKRIAIDEIHIGKGQRYITLVLDLDKGAVVFVGEGKGADALKPFWVRLKASRAKIEAVATDMSSAYISAVLENLPKAIHVFDRFHVVKLFNEHLSELRRELHREAVGPLAKKALKGIRWLLLMNRENLDESRNEHERLKEALDLNAPLCVAYYLKENLRLFWQQESAEAAAAFLDDWCALAHASGIKRLRTMAKTLQGHRTGLLNWYECPISTGPLEGTNNKIRVLQRQSYGFRDHEFFKLKIYALHEAKHALVG